MTRAAQTALVLKWAAMLLKNSLQTEHAAAASVSKRCLARDFENGEVGAVGPSAGSRSRTVAAGQRSIADRRHTSSVAAFAKDVRVATAQQSAGGSRNERIFSITPSGIWSNAEGP